MCRLWSSFMKMSSWPWTATPPHGQIKAACLELQWLLTNVVGEVPLQAVEDEPALLPRLYLAAHLYQVALAHLLRQDDVRAGVHAVARRLHVGAQVKLLLAVGQVARHRPGLRTGGRGRVFRVQRGRTSGWVATVFTSPWGQFKPRPWSSPADYGCKPTQVISLFFFFTKNQNKCESDWYCFLLNSIKIKALRHEMILFLLIINGTVLFAEVASNF